MTRDELMEALHQAAVKYDGHVTHGSMDEIMKLVDQALFQAKAEVFDGIHKLSYETYSAPELILRIGQMYGELLKNNSAKVLDTPAKPKV